MRKLQSSWPIGFVAGFLLMSSSSFLQAEGEPSGSGTSALVPGVRPRADNKDRDQIARDQLVTPQQRMQHEAKQDWESGENRETSNPASPPSAPTQEQEMKERSSH